MQFLRKSISVLFIILLSFTIIVSCDQDKGGDISPNTGAGMQIYYLDATGTSIVGMDYEAENEEANDLIEELIYAIGENPESSSMKKAKPDSVIVESYNLTNDGRLTLDFSPEYNELKGVSEVLCRATIVKTLSQVEEVNYIEFNISGQPLMNSKDMPVGLMQEEDIIYSTNAEDVYVTVYFSDQDGSVLLPSNLRITYDGNISIVELIIDRLILGPVEDGMIQTVPEGTLLNKVTIKEGICYVDFSEEFLNYNPDIEPEIVVYSIVNSLVELSYVNSVQFTIDGSMVEDYNGLKFDEPFKRQLELIEER